jgi:hypothetical protein
VRPSSSSSRRGGGHCYPPAATVLNLSSSLAHLLGLSAPEEELGRPRLGVASWALFSSSSPGAAGTAAFFELVLLATKAFDHAWRVRGASPADFNAVLAAAEASVQRWLEHAPEDLDALRAVAASGE